MSLTSKTGLLASPTKKLKTPIKPKSIQLRVFAKSAPYVLKPFAGLYNPYSYGCSLLCNHPADNEAKQLLKRAKDSWANEEKNLLLADEAEAIRATLDHLQVRITDCSNHTQHNNNSFPIGSVPEELFRRYTETDSRPLTPALTMVSAHTRASSSRRCVTPDPVPTSQDREKTTLILDLRKSHSQEVLSWCSNFQQQEVMPIKITKAPSNRCCHSTIGYTRNCTSEIIKNRNSKTPSPVKCTNYDKVEKHHLEVVDIQGNSKEEEDDDEKEIIKRRGKRRRKRGRDSSRDPPAFQSSIDPETQIATIGSESHNPSTRPSLVPSDHAPLTGNTENLPGNIKPSMQRNSSLDINSYLDAETLKLLRRELNEEVIDKEFNIKRRKALEEALKTIRPNRDDCEELKSLQKQLQLPIIDPNFWLRIPRMFSRSSVRFELPMDSRQFNGLTPLKYLQEYVVISSVRKQLYNIVFNRHKNETNIENDRQRKLSGINILNALNEMMGKELNKEQSERFRTLVGWNDDEVFDFKTFCGLCALCERIFAPEFCPQMPTKKMDPCHEIEAVDFQSLSRRLDGQTADERLVKILYLIKDL